VTPDAQERLDPADVEAGGLLAASHVHRYEFAAGLVAGLSVLDLCCGSGYGSRILARSAGSVHGVDIAADAIATALAEDDGAEADRVTFERADALGYLRALGAGNFDAVVCFEGLEHVDDPDTLVTELLRLADGGTALILSIPNSRGFDERNEFHKTDYGYEEMSAVSERFPGAVVLSQYLAEASLIVGDDRKPMSELRGRLVDGTGDTAWANHWLILVGIGVSDADRAQAALSLAAAANQNQYMRILERANDELYRTNQRLARSRLGVHDAAAASTEATRTKLEAEVGELTHKLEAQRTETERQKARLNAPRYRAVDAIRVLAFTIPGVAILLRARSRSIQRRRSRSK
jgi:2-polyprenyl-3-methyl-5-hydroxy-6-metoxy-1,4-benzoquinol methylase